MRIMFDPGHGGSDSGAVANGLIEKTLTLQTASLAAAALRAHVAGWVDGQGQTVEVQLTRTDDSTLPQAERLRRIAIFNPQICVSIHYNAADNTGASGVEVFHSARDVRDNQLAQLLVERIKQTGIPSRGVKTRTNTSGGDYYYIIREVMDADTIALLVECAFVTSAEDAAKIKAGWAGRAALAIADAVFEHIRPQLTAVPVGPAVVFAGRVYPAQIIDNLTWTPVRAIAEAAGLKVIFDATTKITTLSK